MRRTGWHLGFWGLYFLQNVLLIFLVNGTRLRQPAIAHLWLAAANCAVLLLPKLLFTYFLLRVVPGRTDGAGRPGRDIGSVLLALLATLLLYRALVVLFVDPVIYHWRGGEPFASPLGFLVALMDVGFVSGVALAIRQSRLQRNARERALRLERERLEAELKFLRYQTNPHFLFNTLNNIYALARKKSDQTPEVVLRLSKLLRFMLYESAGPMIAIADEVRVLDDYIELEKIRYDSRLTVNFYRDIDDPSEPAAPLLLLPFVENAFKHGAAGGLAESFVHLELIVQEGRLEFSVENSVEDAGSATGATEGIGLRNVRRQLELTYREYHIEIQRGPGTFRVSLTINLKTREQDPLPLAGR